MKSKTGSIFRNIFGFLFLIMFIISLIFKGSIIRISNLYTGLNLNDNYFNLLSIAELSLCFICVIRSKNKKNDVIHNKEKFSPKDIIAVLLVIILVPLTILFGVYVLKNENFYLISLLIILELTIPFIFIFERKKNGARELIIISVLSALAVLGRAAFIVIPQFKPIVAMIIVYGICFGGEVGFITGAVSALVSNFMFSQGPWTPWQMFALGITGFVSGLIFNKGLLKSNKIIVTVFGGFITVVLYGLIGNISSVILWQASPTFEMFIATIAAGIPYDLIHAVSTIFFLWFFYEPIAEILDRIKTKFGI